MPSPPKFEASALITPPKVSISFGSHAGSQVLRVCTYRDPHSPVLKPVQGLTLPLPVRYEFHLVLPSSAVLHTRHGGSVLDAWEGLLLCHLVDEEGA